ncbi:hypothetical protein [Bacillus xiapuensis]|nr:hypothetical protein [Bacillus xiapuensis]
MPLSQKNSWNGEDRTVGFRWLLKTAINQAASTPKNAGVLNGEKFTDQ